MSELDELQIIPPTAAAIKQSRTFRDLTGSRFGRLTVLGRSARRCKNEYKWVCKCDCGNKKAVWAVSLKRGDTVSCGCVRSIVASVATSARGRKVCKCGAPIEKRYYRNGGACKRCRHEYSRKWWHVTASQLRDSYIRQMLRGRQWNAQLMPKDAFVPEIIAAKREQLKVLRLLKDKYGS